MVTVNKLYLVRGFGVWMALLVGVGGVVSADVGADAGTSVAALIQQLGADGFRDRRDAEQELMRRSRDILPALREAARADDPEIATRSLRIITHLLTSPDKIPTAILGFDPGEENLTELRRNWGARATAWREKSEAGAVHDAGDSATSGNFAQSFVPKCEQIAVVELVTYPVNNVPAWLRVDICTDHDGWPGEEVLARCWIRIEADNPVSHGMSLPYDIPDIDVDPDATYWLCYREFPDDGSSTVVNYKLSTDSSYKEGKLLRAGTSNQPSENEDAHFRLLSACAAVPNMAPVAADTGKALPEGPEVEAVWPYVQPNVGLRNQRLNNMRLQQIRF